jgi:hypothetical protein
MVKSFMEQALQFFAAEIFDEVQSTKNPKVKDIKLFLFLLH